MVGSGLDQQDLEQQDLEHQQLDQQDGVNSAPSRFRGNRHHSRSRQHGFTPPAAGNGRTRTHP